MGTKRQISDDESNELMACILYKLGVPVPGPGAGLVIEGVDRAPASHGQSRAAVVLEMYRDALVHVAGAWAYQQKLVIEQMQRQVEACRENDDGKGAAHG